MMHGRVVEYSNDFSNGPVGLDYLLPLDADRPADLSPWAQRFADLKSENVFAVLSRQWGPISSIIRPMVDFFSKLESASIYVLPDESFPNRDWLLLRNRKNVFFFAEPSPLPKDMRDFNDSIVLLMSKFNGIRIGFRMDDCERFLRQDSGFVPGACLQVLSEFDYKSWLRSGDRSFLGCLPFFDTPCGNKFLALRSGAIAKWDHDTTEISICFQGVSEFVELFTAFYFGLDTGEDSPFFY
jgi:hypothetical protein